MVRFSNQLGSLTAAVALLLSYSSPWGVDAYTLDPNSRDSIKSVAKNMADDMLSFYNGDKPGGTPGLLPQPYYWWEAGAMLGALVDYWYYTADSSYNNLITEGLLFQTGENDDYMPRNQTLTEGNDDQGFWALTVMSAAENNFPNPPPDKPQWLGLAQAVFNTQAARWDTEHCAGGLRWQIFHWNKGFDYKNSISQACFFALGARLAVYTGNSSYADWAEKTWDWMINVKFIDEYWRVFDGAHITTNCTNIVPYQFSYNAGGMILGAAAMYNFTEDRKWKDRLDNLLEGSKVFFTGPESNIMTEVACEPVDRCNLDQQSFKAYFSRWLAAITKWAPHTYDFVIPYLKASAVAAAKQCVGGSNGRMCGLKWNQDKYDGSTGIGQQMAALEVTLSCMIKDRAAPVTAHTGGTSKGKPGGGGDDIGRQHPKGPNYKPITAGDKAGAAILTLLVMLGMMAGMFWIFLDESSSKGPLEQVKGAGGAAAHSMAALAAAGGVAAITRRSRGTGPVHNEKNDTFVSVVGDHGPQSGTEGNKVAGMATIKVGKVRSKDGGPYTQRVSSMPLGWPHNPNLRSSSAGEASRDRLVPSRQGDRPSPSVSETLPSATSASTMSVLEHGTPRSRS